MLSWSRSYFSLLNSLWSKKLLLIGWPIQRIKHMADKLGDAAALKTQKFASQSSSFGATETYMQSQSFFSYNFFGWGTFASNQLCSKTPGQTRWRRLLRFHWGLVRYIWQNLTQFVFSAFARLGEEVCWVESTFANVSQTSLGHLCQKSTTFHEFAKTLRIVHILNLWSNVVGFPWCQS